MGGVFTVRRVRLPKDSKIAVSIVRGPVGQVF